MWCSCPIVRGRGDASTQLRHTAQSRNNVIAFITQSLRELTQRGKERKREKGDACESEQEKDI